MFTKILGKNYLVKTWLIAILVINGLEVLVMQVGRAENFVLSQQPLTTEATEELIINGTLNENSEQFEHDGSYFQLHTFTGKAGDVITIELNSSEFDAYLALMDPKFKGIAKNDNGGKGSNAKITITLPTTGIYTVVVKAFEKGQQGSYKLSWREASAKDQSLASATELNDKAFELYKQGKYDEAVSLLEQSLKIRQQVLGAEHPSVATSLNSLALLYTSQGRYTEAEPLFIQALDMRKKLLGSEHPDVATSLNNLALLYQRQGRYTESEPLFIQALDMTKKLLGAEHPSVATSLNNLAFLYNAQGRYTEAEPLYIQALDMTKKLLGAEHPDVAASLNNLAALYQRQGRYTESEPLYIQALDMTKKLLGSEHPYVATSLNNLAGLYQPQGRYTEAEPLFIQALDMTKKLLGSEHPDVATSLNNLAGLYNAQGRYTEAEPLYIQALDMRKKLLGAEHPDVATSLNNLAGLYNAQGRYTEAEPLYIQALDMRKKLLGAEHPDVAASLNNLALLYQRQGRYTEAEPLFIQALDMIKKLLGAEHPSVATSLNNLALLYDSQGRYTEAEPLYIQALDMRKKLLGAEHPDVATSLNNLAALYESQGRYTEAEPLYIQALDMRKKLLGAEHPDVASSLNNLAELYESQGDIASAVQYLKRGLEIQEKNLTYNLVAGAEPQKDEYLKTISGTKNGAISLHLQTVPNNREATTLAFTIILRRKGRLLQFLTASRKILRQQLDPQGLQWLDELDNIHGQLSTLLYNRPENLPLETYRDNFAKLKQQAKELENKISRRSSEFRTSTQPVTLEAIQQLIPANAALVEFIEYSPYDPKTETSGEPRYGVYVLNAEGEPQGIDLGTVEEIKSDLDKFRVLLKKKRAPLEKLKKTARELDEKLMQPVRQLIGSKEQILISPDSHLNLIPFEALVDENHKYLVENYSITYLSSGRDLLQLTTKARKTSAAVLLGDPNYGKKDKIAPHRSFNKTSSNIALPRLLETADEVKAIGKLLGVKPLLRGAATEKAIKQAQNPFILHIATHGLFEESKEKPQNPEELPIIERKSLLRSGLALAGFKEENIVGDNGVRPESEQKETDEDNGFLTALEATGLKLLGTELVVLSACDTGLGGISPGEGVYGLRRAFFIAGSQSQVISLWQVDDEGTKDLMVKYYQRLLDGNIGRTEALRKTQLEMLRGEAGENYSHPYYWASFIPSGNWQPIPPRLK